ncbi:MAG: hypothetical protein LBT08_06595 [Synergistaceae bacterium]|jgi:hypothetical protein|nr:hypothetical protein [Synergistaceae bacterium]
MGSRLLSREENDSLSPEAVRLVYRHIHSQYCTPDIMEKVLLQAVLVSRINQCRVDEGMLSFLIEKISEYEGTPVLGPVSEDGDAAYRYC